MEETGENNTRKDMPAKEILVFIFDTSSFSAPLLPRLFVNGRYEILSHSRFTQEHVNRGNPPGNREPKHSAHTKID